MAIKVTMSGINHTANVSLQKGTRIQASEPGTLIPVGARVYVEETESGATITITDKEGTTTANLYNGTDGEGGQDGYTPVKGVDYFDGADGQDGVGIVSIVQNADYTLTITLSDGTMLTTAPVIGQKGDKGDRGDTGATGNGIASAVLNADYTLTLTFTDGTSYTTTSIRGEAGAKGDKGDAGTTDYEELENKPNLKAVATSGSYNDLSDKPTIPTVPTNISAFDNDAGYLTAHQDISGKSDKVDTDIDQSVITLYESIGWTQPT